MSGFVRLQCTAEDEERAHENHLAREGGEGV